VSRTNRRCLKTVSAGTRRCPPRKRGLHLDRLAAGEPVGLDAGPSRAVALASSAPSAGARRGDRLAVGVSTTSPTAKTPPRLVRRPGSVLERPSGAPAPATRARHVADRDEAPWPPISFPRRFRGAGGRRQLATRPANHALHPLSPPPLKMYTRSISRNSSTVACASQPQETTTPSPIPRAALRASKQSHDEHIKPSRRPGPTRPSVALRPPLPQPPRAPLMRRSTPTLPAHSPAVSATSGADRHAETRRSCYAS